MEAAVRGILQGMQFVCNVCGAECSATGRPPREGAGCERCGSSLRLRALIALLSEEIFGTLLALPEFPPLKGIRGIGMSDTPEVAARLAEKFDYANTFYHQPPRFDVTRPDAQDSGRYDFILSSEVMEHVPPPVERSFAALHSMLKPDGLLLMTTPYTVGGETAEHFPELHEYSLAAPGGKTILVNRRRDGEIEVFENLVFHGGHGSTLELRTFSEGGLRAALCAAGFGEVRFAPENHPEFGIDHAEALSLPVAARTGKFQAPTGELAIGYREACRLAARKIRDLETITAEYERHIGFHHLSHQQWKQEMEQRLAWIRKVEADWQDRTRWAADLEREKTEAIAEFRRLEISEKEAWDASKAATEKLARLNSSWWTRFGRMLRIVD